MYTSTISTKYQVVIPSEVRKEFNIKPGQKITFIPYKKTLHLMIAPPIVNFTRINGHKVKVIFDIEPQIQ